jgi:hypothetical protein
VKEKERESKRRGGKVEEGRERRNSFKKFML